MNHGMSHGFKEVSESCTLAAGESIGRSIVIFAVLRSDFEDTSYRVMFASASISL
jgi:hypothetical protein